MKITKKSFFKTVLSCLCLTIFSTCIAAVPNEYKANYGIQNDRNEVSRIFVEIEANNDIWVQTNSSTFAALYNHFSNIFPKFPQEYTFKVTYQRCLQLTQTLWSHYDYNNFVSFMDLCFDPLSTILSQIDANYTVTAIAKANPTTWPAPLTVTFDARNSVDPSNETIPSNNYYRYYRDVAGVDQAIWVWPVLSYTFSQAWNHQVHLTVRSSNSSDGIFDWEKTLSINVTPQSAIISVYANSQKLNTNEKQKFGTQEWLNWIVLDGSATIPVWWRVLQSYLREITSTDGFSYKKDGAGTPWIIKVVFPSNWEYTVKLTTIDNEWNNISASYPIIIADPVAIIKQTPTEWNTSITFSFDSNSSYSVMSNLRLYTWEIFDTDWTKLQTYQWKSIKYQFKKPWTYTVKLTVEDELWQSNIDTTQVYVASSAPDAQFKMIASEYWKYPSKYYLDASASSDVDVNNKFDTLSYEWIFSDPEHTNIEEIDNDNKTMTISFDSLWTHTVKLIVTDKFWVSSEIEKTVDVKSTLRPEIITNSATSVRWERMDFSVQSNEDIISYTWDFGDKTVVTTQTNKISHTYENAGTYEVKLKVIGTDFTENEVYKNIFVWNANEPIWWYTVKWSNQQWTIRQNEECSYVSGWQEYTVPAYKVTRYEKFTIDPKDSRAIDGSNNNIVFYFQEKMKDIFKTNSTYNSSFRELGCTYIDMTVEDTSIWVNSKTRIWFKVYNNLPTIDNVTLSFPQYGNESWIGFNEWYVQDIFNSNYDPLIVKVTASNAKDPDGFISYFKWYYYYKDDPNRILETKITPSDINYTFFSLPQMPGEFMFGVTMYDNDDWKASSEDILWNWPIVFFPPDTQRPDIPIVTLKVNRSSVEVWDEVTFDVISKIISDREDFVQERTIMYDFDWDGERDLTTKSDRVTYTYTEANDVWYIPRAAVLYRWYQWDAKWEAIIVKNWLKPRTMFVTAGKFVLFRDISLWEIEESTTCLSLVDCKRDIPWYLLDTSKDKYFFFEYPTYDKYYLSVNIKDKYANEASKQTALMLTWIEIASWEYVNYTWDIKILSIPEFQENESGAIEIAVWKSLNNSILFYILYNDPEWNKQCYVDLDISDWKEKDFYCNQIYLAEFDPKYENLVWKLYYQTDYGLKTKDINISFLDYAIQLDENTKVIYNKLVELINSISDESTLKSLLLNLQKWILNTAEVQSNVVAINEYLATTTDLNLTDAQMESLKWILNELSDSTTVSAAWWNAYEIAKIEILSILPTNLKVIVEQLFYDFENAKWDQENWITENDAKKSILNEIISTISSKITADETNQKEDEITRSDMEDIIMPNMCNILNYFDIPSEKCSSSETKIVENTDSIQAENWTSWKSALKIILIVIWSIVWVLVLLVVVFALKARLKKDEEW